MRGPQLNLTNTLRKRERRDLLSTDCTGPWIVHSACVMGGDRQTESFWLTRWRRGRRHRQYSPPGFDCGLYEMTRLERTCYGDV